MKSLEVSVLNEAIERLEEAKLSFLTLVMDVGMEKDIGQAYRDGTPSNNVYSKMVKALDWLKALQESQDEEN